MTHTLISCDPGETTGWGLVEIGEQKIESWEFGEQPYTMFNRWADYFIRGHGGQITVYCERYVITEGTTKKSRGNTHWSLETIGVLRHLCDITSQRFVLQGVGDAVEFGNDHLLKRVGWWTAGDVEKGIEGTHARDAARHMLLGISRDHGRAFWELVK